jgi:glyoxylase I family protein
MYRSPDEPTGRANARPMTGSATSGAVLEWSRMSLRSSGLRAERKKGNAMELKLHHVNYSTKDVGAVAEFYRSLFNMKPVPSYGDAQITSQGYDRKVEFLTDGTTEFHIAPQDLGVAFRTKQSLNPLDRGHIAFRTDDIEAFKALLREKNIQFADYGVWAIGGWYQIFLQDPDGTIVEVHQTDYKQPGV